MVEPTMADEMLLHVALSLPDARDDDAKPASTVAASPHCAPLFPLHRTAVPHCTAPLFPLPPPKA